MLGETDHEIIKLLAEATVNSLITCGGCGAILQEDCRLCGDCGWVNPLVKYHYI